MMKKRFGFVKRLVTLTLAVMITTATIAPVTVHAYVDPFAQSHANRGNSTPGPCDPSRSPYAPYAPASGPAYSPSTPSRNVGGSYYTVYGTTNYLALRTQTCRDASNEIGRIFNGDTVQLVDSSMGYTGYWYVYSPTLGMYGYVNKSYLC